MRRILKFVTFFSTLVNISFSIESETVETNYSVTNIIGEISTEKRLPNIYLKDKTITNQTDLSFARRYDAVYFIAIPVTYYLTFNLLQQKNWYLRQSFTLDKSDEVFLYFNTLFLPFIVAYFDFVFVSNYNQYKYESRIFKDSVFQLNFYIKQF